MYDGDIPDDEPLYPEPSAPELDVDADGPRQCRNCLGGNDEGIDFIAPCKCKGTVKWVHRHCLDQWRTVSPNRDALLRCELCHAKYQFELMGTKTPLMTLLKCIVMFIWDMFVLFATWQILVLMCCVVVLIADPNSVVQKDLYGDGLTPTLSVYLSGMLIFFAFLGVIALLLGVVKSIGYLVNKMRGTTPAQQAQAVTPPRNQYHYRHRYHRSYFMNDYFIWYYMFRPRYHRHYPSGGSSSGGGISAPIIKSAGKKKGGKSECGGSLLLIILVILIVIGMVFGAILVTYYVANALRKRLAEVKGNDEVKHLRVLDLSCVEDDEIQEV